MDTVWVVIFPLAWNRRNHLCVDCWEGVEFRAASFAKYVRAWIMDGLPVRANAEHCMVDNQNDDRANNGDQNTIEI